MMTLENGTYNDKTSSIFINHLGPGQNEHNISLSEADKGKPETAAAAALCSCCRSKETKLTRGTPSKIVVVGANLIDRKLSGKKEAFPGIWRGVQLQLNQKLYTIKFTQPPLLRLLLGDPSPFHVISCHQGHLPVATSCIVWLSLPQPTMYVYMASSPQSNKCS